MFVVAPLTDVVDRIAKSQSRRAERYLGNISQNVSVAAWDGAINRMSQSKWAIKLLILAADSLREVPYHENIRARDFDDEAVGKARAYILNTIRKEAVKAINKAFDEQPTLDSIDFGESVLDNFKDVGDPVAEKFGADRKPLMQGFRFTGPGEVDWTTLSMAIAHIITEKRLDPLTEIMLNDDYLTKDGSFMWAEHGDKVWQACGLPLNAYFKQTDRRKRAEMAKRVARNRFSWLPDAIEGALVRLAPELWDTPRDQYAFIRSDVSQHVQPNALATLLRSIVEMSEPVAIAA